MEPIRLLLVCGVLALAACGAPVDERARIAGVLHEDRADAPRTAPSAAPSPVLEREAANTSLAPLAPRPEERTAPPKQTARDTTRREPAPVQESETAEAAEPAIETIDPARLVGLGRSELADLMGAPMILRNEPPGELWLYKNTACVAHVYLYETTGPDDNEVRYVEARGTDTALSTGQCLAAFATEAASTVSLNRETDD